MYRSCLLELYDRGEIKNKIEENKAMAGITCQD